MKHAGWISLASVPPPGLFKRIPRRGGRLPGALRWCAPPVLADNASPAQGTLRSLARCNGRFGRQMIPWFNRQLKWLLALAMLAGLAWWVGETVGWAELLRPWRDIPPGELVLLVILTALSYLTRALRLYDLYSPRLAGPFRLYLRINVLHTTVLNLLPMRMGEAAFPLMMKRYFGERYASSVANLLWLRVADLWVLVWLGMLVFAVRGTAWLWLPVLAGALMPLLLQPLRKYILHATVASERRTARLLRILVEGLPGHFSRYLRLLFWTVLTWGLKLAAFASVAAFFIDGPVTTLIPGIIAAEISNALPVQGVAGFGNYEVAMVLGGAWSSLPVQALLVAALNLHLFILACTLLFGVMALAIPTGQAARQAGDPTSNSR